MVLFIGYHSERNTLPHRSGLFVFHPDMRNNDAPCEWAGVREQGNLWQVAYCGPMFPDPLVRNAVILPSVTPVTLVSGNA